ncbi:hypothetical protein PoB_005795900 [Plakobranchus ocellatus]|uniref:Uncharacterized protein n=1 Tax=Plakobranchus ocellatus TaxID=259542 RepID=A0AAV4CKK6_9GAST|nr:hypothetical protein PoB_005795900 [Plakobranchus ocellatus]
MILGKTGSIWTPFTDSQSIVRVTPLPRPHHENPRTIVVNFTIYPRTYHPRVWSSWILRVIATKRPVIATMRVLITSSYNAMQGL